MKFNRSLQIKSIQTFGNSMYPLLIDKDIVHYKKIPVSKIKVDDLIGFIRNHQIINHRVIYKSEKYLLTKGDHNFKPDPKVYPKSIVGKITHVTRKNQIINPENIYLLQSVNYFPEIIKITRLFDRNKINYTFIKGLPVYLYYAKTHPRRIYADCDVLTQPQYLSRVDRILHNLGYKKQTTSINPLLDIFLKQKLEVTYWKNVNNVIVSFDIHLEAVFLMVQTSNLYPLYPKSLVKKFSKKLLDQKKAAYINNNVLPLLTTENQIIYLALHLFHDNFKGYYKYNILQKVINSSKFKEEKIVNAIKEYKLESFLYPVFAILTKHYTPKLSSKFLKHISPKKKLKLINQFIQKINIFEDDNRIHSGIKRFRSIYSLSPTPIFLKPLVFLNPKVLFLVVFVILRKLKFQLYSFMKLQRHFPGHKLIQSKPKKVLRQQAVANQNQPSH